MNLFALHRYATRLGAASTGALWGLWCASPAPWEPPLAPYLAIAAVVAVASMMVTLAIEDIWKE